MMVAQVVGRRDDQYQEDAMHVRHSLHHFPASILDLCFFCVAVSVVSCSWPLTAPLQLLSEEAEDQH